MRRWKRRLLLGALFAALAILAVPAALAQAARGLTNLPKGGTIVNRLVPLVALLGLVAAVETGAFASASRIRPAPESQSTIWENRISVTMSSSDTSRL